MELDFFQNVRLTAEYQECVEVDGRDTADLPPGRSEFEVLDALPHLVKELGEDGIRGKKRESRHT